MAKCKLPAKTKSEGIQQESAAKRRAISELGDKRKRDGESSIVLNLKGESLAKQWQDTVYWFPNLLDDCLFILAIYSGVHLVRQEVGKAAEIGFQLFILSRDFKSPKSKPMKQLSYHKANYTNPAPEL